jgi:hypothetical protein
VTKRPPPGTGTSWGLTAGLDSHIYAFLQNGKPAMQFFGYGQIASADFLYYPASATSTKTVKFDVDASAVFTHTLQYSGFLINAGTSGTGSSKTMDGYLLIFAYGPAGSTSPATSLAGVYLYKLTGVNVDSLHNSNLSYIPDSATAGKTLVATSAFNTFYTKSRIGLTITPTGLAADIQQLDAGGALTGSKSTLFSLSSLTNTGYGGFGPYVDYNGHGCTIASSFRFTNLEMAFSETLSGNSALEAYQYADYLNDSRQQFFVNMTNASTSYTATTTDTDNAYLSLMSADRTILITDEYTGTYLPVSLGSNAKSINDVTHVTDGAITSLYSGSDATEKRAAKVAWLIYNTTYGTGGTITPPITTAIASLMLFDSPGTTSGAVWTGVNQVNQIKKELMSGGLNIYLNPDSSQNAGGLTASFVLTYPNGTTAAITPLTDGANSNKLYFVFPTTAVVGDYKVTLSYAASGSITSTIPATATFSVLTDTTAPSVSASLNGNNVSLTFTNATSGAITAYTSDLDCYVVENTASATTPTSTWTNKITITGTSASVPITQAGYMHILVKDKAGNIGTTYIQIIQLIPTVTAPVASDITFGQALSASTLTNGAAEYNSANVPGTFTWTAPATKPLAGSTAYSVTFTPDSALYATCTTTAAVLVGKATPSITLSDKTANFTGSPITITAVVTGESGVAAPTGAVSYIYYTDISCTTLTTPGNSGASANGGAPVFAGKYYAKATLADLGNYFGATTAAPGTLTIAPISDAGLAINGAPTTITYGDTSFTLTSSGGNGTGAVTFVSSNPLVASISSNGYVTVKKVGSTVITATKAADSNYQAQSVTKTLVVAAKPVTYSITGTGKVYNGFTQFAAVTPSEPGFTQDVDFTVTYSQGSTVVSSPKEMGSYAIAVATTDSNYTGSASGTLTISATGQTALEITGVPVDDLQYNDTFVLTANGGSGTGAITWASSNSAIASVDSAGTVLITGIGAATITAERAADSNFTKQTATVRFTTVRKVINVIATATDRNFAPANLNVTVTLATGVTGVTASHVSATIPSANAGSGKEVTVTGVSLSDAKYRPASTTIYTTVNIAAISDTTLVISGKPASLTYGDRDFQLTASSTGTGEIRWNSDDIDVATVNSNTGVVTITGHGTANITADKASDGNYNSQSASVSLTIGQKAVTYAITGNNPIYTGFAQYATVAPSVSSLVEGLDYSVSYSKAGTDVEEPTDAGTYDMTVTTLNSHYTGFSTTADLTIQSIDQDYTLQIGGLPSYIEYEDAFALYANGGNGTGTVSWQVASGGAATINGSGLVEITGVGSVTITAKKAADVNFNEQTQSVTFMANKKSLSVSISETAKTFNGNVQAIALTGTATSENTLAQIMAITYVSQTDGLPTSFRNTGTYNVSAAIGAGFTGLYVLEGSASAIATMAKANLTITADNKTKTYGNANPTLTMSYTLLGTDTTISLPGISCAATVQSAVGDYDITLAYAADHGNTNYNITLVKGTLTIEKAPLTVIADDKSVSYLDGIPTYTVSYSGLTAGDGSSALGGSLNLACSYHPGDGIGPYTITPSGKTSGNYTISYQTGTLTVGKLAVTLTASGTTQLVTILLSPPVKGLTLENFDFGEGLSPVSLSENTSGSKYFISVNMTEGTEYEVTADYGQNYQFNVARFTATIPHSGGAPIIPPLTLTVTDTSSKSLENPSLITAEADMSKAFLNSVEVRITDVQSSSDSIFSLTGTDGIVYPFDISLYDVATKQKVQPNAGYKVTITLPLPAALWDSRENVRVVYINNGKLVTLASTLLFKDNVWCIVFEAEHFSPYALVVVNAETEFIDVLPTDWFHDAVAYVNRLGLMSGTSATTFEPQTNTTRGMIVTILHRLEGKTAAKTPGTFKDVATGLWYTDAVAWAAENAIVVGYGPLNYKPDQNISRQELAAIFHRYAKFKGYDISKTIDLGTFEDATKVYTWAKPNMNWVVAEGLMSGTSKTRLSPESYATRAQVATMLMRFLENIAK